VSEQNGQTGGEHGGILVDTEWRVLHVGPDIATTGGMATVIGLLSGSTRAGVRHGNGTTWRPGSRTHGLFPALSLIYGLVSSKQTRPEWIHAHLSERGSFLREGAVLLVARSLGIGTAATVHGAEFVAFSLRHPRLVRGILGPCRVVFTLGPFAAARASTLCPATPVSQIMNPIDLDGLAGTPPSSVRSSVLFGGEVGRRKGVDRLVQAWPDVRRRHPGATCVLCGPLGDFSVDALPEGMTYLGSVPRQQLLGLLKTADVACLPSRNEALPMFILESLALGVPVVTTPVGEIGQLGEMQGVALTDGDPSDLAARLTELLGDSEKRTDWGRRGSEWARENCSVESVTESLASAYRAELVTT
jgi:glycosyltransferase involved in cell wall biosynthesis